MDGGAWWATVHRVAKSWTQLSDLNYIYSITYIHTHIHIFHYIHILHTHIHIYSITHIHTYIYSIAYVCVMEYYLAIKKNEMPFATTCIDLEIIK